jgi:CheY-like chemotaxis protein
MPGKNGVAVLEHLAAHPSLARRNPVVVATAYADDPKVMATVYADAPHPLRLAKLLTDLEVPVLDKPFAMDDLLAAVAWAEQRRSQQQAIGSSMPDARHTPNAH